MKVISFAQRYNYDNKNEFYFDIAFLDVSTSMELDPLEKNYLQVNFIDKRFFIGGKPSNIMEYKKGFLMFDHQEQINKDRTFNCIYRPSDDFWILRRALKLLWYYENT